MSALRLGQPVRIDDIFTETRWPRWTESVAEFGMRAVLSSPMMLDGAPIGAIKVYSRLPQAFGARDEQVLALYATQAAILVADTRSHPNAVELTGRMKAALRTRDIIGMAKGILMVNRDIEETAAFAILSQTSRRSHSTMRDVAQRMIDDECAVKD